MRGVSLCCLVLIGICSLGLAADFGQWRGPQRDGIAGEGPGLWPAWARTGPAKLWESEPVAGSAEGGYGCVSVADGRAYVYSNWKYKVDIKQRTLSDSGLRQLGWTDRKPPEELVKAVEEARVSPEREKLVGKPLQDWVKNWVEDKLKTEPERKLSAAFATDRLSRGKKALPLETLAKLEAIKGKEFADAEGLDRWLADNGIAEEVKQAVVKVVPTFVTKAWDIVFCFDGTTGRTLWKKQYDGRADAQPASGTPTIAAGRCYVAGSDGDVYCLDAKTGEEVWKAKPVEKAGLVHSSVLVVEGKAVALVGQLVALDAGSGSILWKQPKVGGRDGSPVAWRNNGKTYVICNAGEVRCVDLVEGKLAWSVPGGGLSSPVLAGENMVVCGKEKVGLVAYRLTATQPEKLWSMPDYFDDASPVIHDGYVYAVGQKGAVCVELASGKIAWEDKTAANRETSPLLADGKIIVVLNKGLEMFGASPAKYNLLAKVTLPVAEYTSPALVGGRLYLRLAKSVACFDLTKAPSATQPDSLAPPPVPPRRGLASRPSR